MGNQLFQIAAAKGIAEKTNTKLQIECRFNFVFDHQYKRKFRLIDSPEARHSGVLVPLICRILKNFNSEKERYSLWQAEILLDKNKKYHPIKLANPSKIKAVWLWGYFQSPKYFSENPLRLLEESFNEKKIGSFARQKAHQIQGSESCSLCLRWYEESRCPENHAHNGEVKTLFHLKQTISVFRSRHPRAKFYIFSTRQPSDEIWSLVPNESEFVLLPNSPNHDWDRLWVLSHCRHHIITNSTFYWWGAWWSEQRWLKQGIPQTVFAADNFVNQDIYPPHWSRF